MDSLPNWLSANKLYHAPSIDNINKGSDDDHKPNNDRKEVHDVSDANLIGSKCSDPPHELHKIFLDIDVEHHYQPSRTEGHGHLMLNVNVTKSELNLLNEFLVTLGITGRGNQQQVTKEGQNFLRINATKSEEYKKFPKPEEDNKALWEKFYELKAKVDGKAKSPWDDDPF